MPLIEVKLVEGALDDKAKARLARALSDVFLKHQGASLANRTAASITQVEIAELRPAHVFRGGDPAPSSTVRLVFHTPGGALDAEAKASLVRAATAICETVLGPGREREHLVWCMIAEVPDGHWASDGRLFTWAAIKRYVMRGEIRRRRLAHDAPELNGAHGHAGATTERDR